MVAGECQAVGRRISTSKSDVMVLAKKGWIIYSVSGESHSPKVEEFKYLGVLFKSEGKMEQGADRWIGVVSAVIQTLKCSV